MLKPLGFLALWLVGTATAVAVAWAGVSVVDNELVRPAPANVLALRADSVEPVGSTETVPADSTDVASATASTTAVPPTTSPTTTSPAPTSPAPTSTTTAPTTTSPGSTSTSTAPSTTTTTTTAPATTSPVPTNPAPTNPVPTNPASTSTTTAPPTTSPGSTSTTTVAPPTQTLTFHLIGGSTAIGFSSTGATVLWASPNPGFDVDIDHGFESRVEFESDDHKTRIDAWWSGGPQHEIREDAD